MNNNEPGSLSSRLKQLIADRFRLELAQLDNIPHHGPLIGGSLGLDSLDAVDLAMCIEEEFDITIGTREESHRAFASIASLAGFIHARTQAVYPASSRPAPAATLSLSS